MKPANNPGLDRYELRERIEDDAAGETWIALRGRPERLVRLRILKHELLTRDDLRSRVLAELRLAASVRHGSLAEAIDAGEANGRLFVAYDWHDGVTLARRLREGGRFPVKDAVRIATDIAGALEKARAETGVWHGHLSPDSIHLRPEGDVSILDLGLSGIRPLWSAGHIEMRRALLEFNPYYCAPEIVRGAAVVDHRADIYSLGAVLYHMVTGVKPFGRRPPREALDQHRMGFLEDPCDAVPELPHAAGWLIEFMMARDPAQRLPDWSQVLGDLGSVESGGNAARPKPCAGASVIRRNAQRDPLLAARLHQKPAPPKAGRPARADKKKIRLPSHAHPRKPARPRSGAGARVRFLSIAIVIAGLGAYAYRLHGHKLSEFALPPSMVAIRMDRKAANGAEPSPDPATGDAPMPPAWNEIARATTTNAATARPRPVRTPAAPAPAPRKDELVGDPRFVKAADLFNEALARFKKFEETRNAAILDEVPALSEQAARIFEACEKDFPADRRLKRHIDESYGLARYARQAMLTAGRDIRKTPRR